MNVNPFGEFRRECEKAVEKAVKQLHPDIVLPSYILSIPPSPDFGDLSCSVCFEISRTAREPPPVLASKISEEILRSLKMNLVEKVNSVKGYINFFVNLPKLSELTVNAAEHLQRNYGFIKTDKPKKIIVEHTSANPSGPLHIGTARNAILGDFLARTLKARGHQVRRHFYVDDVGRQVAIASYGYKILGMPPIKGKTDRFIGLIYTATNCAIEIKTLKEKISTLQNQEGREKLNRKLDDYLAVATDLQTNFKEEFNTIWEAVSGETDPEKTIEHLIKAYEKKDPGAVNLICKTVKASLEGFKETLAKAGIEFDSWDWESQLLWEGKVKEAVDKLKQTPYTFQKEGSLILNVDLAAERLGVKEKFFGSNEAPQLVLMRSDGTTLYTTRDIAYHIDKFKWADEAVNVVGVDQRLAQLQLRIALLILGIEKALDNLIHYAYELVKLPGYTMSRRRGRYVSFDELIDEAVTLAYREVSKRSPQLDEAEKRAIANSVGLGAVKYAMLSISPTKTVNFTWERVLNFETNAAPYVQYAHARACSIIGKAEFKPENPDYTLLSDPLEKALTVNLSRFPEIFSETADSLKPELLIDYANSLADSFNAFYNKLPVLKAEKKSLRDARLKLVNTSAIVLRNTLELLGIEAPVRM